MAMEGTVWHSGIMSSGEIGNKQGLATKWVGREWDAPTFIVPEKPPGKLDEMMRYVRGEPLPREAFPEALYVFDRKRFEKIGDLFTAGGFYAAKGKLANGCPCNAVMSDHAKANWHFTTPNARIKLKRLYPSI